MSVTFYFDRISRVSCVRTTSKAHSRCRTKVSLLYELLCTPLYVRIEVPLRNFRRSHNIIMMVMDDALKKWRRCRWWFHRKKKSLDVTVDGENVLLWSDSWTNGNSLWTEKLRRRKWLFIMMIFEKSSMFEAFFPIFLSYGHCLSVQCTPWIYLRDMNVHYVETEILSWQKWPYYSTAQWYSLLLNR